MSESAGWHDLGWSESFEIPFRAAASTIAGAVAARIVREDRGLFGAIAGGANLAQSVKRSATATSIPRAVGLTKNSRPVILNEVKNLFNLLTRLR